MIIPGLSESDSADRFRELHTALRRPIEAKSATLQVNCSMGVTWQRHGDDTPQNMLERADEALYRAKKRGRNRIVFAMPGSAAEACEAASLAMETGA